jgi:hypothetical protein
MRLRIILALWLLWLLVSTVARGDFFYVGGFTAGVIKRFDSQGNGSTFVSGFPLTRTLGLTLDANGNLYVADGPIWKFDPSGQLQWPPLIFATHPSDVFADNEGNIFVVDGFGSINKYDLQGDFLSSYQVSSSVWAWKMTVDVNENIYAGLLGGGIEKFDAQGHGTAFASPGIGVVTALTTDHSGDLFVGAYFPTNLISTTRSNVIFKFNPSGGVSLFAVMQPQATVTGLGIDSGGNLCALVEATNSVLERFDANGNGTVFAQTGLGPTWGLAIQVPEPGVFAVGAVGVAGALASRRGMRAGRRRARGRAVRA